MSKAETCGRAEDAGNAGVAPGVTAKVAAKVTAKVAEEVHRPWGGYLVIDEGAGFKVKRIWVNPGEILSLQLHNHRDEHWVIVTGIGDVTTGKVTVARKKNETAFIPKQTKHRIGNPGTEMLEFIEVQIGEYLGEDDIVRFEDKYHR